VGDRLSPGVMNPSLAIARSGIWPKRPNRGSGLSWASTCSVGYTEIARVENLRRPKFFERYSRPWQRAPAFRWRRLSSAERARAALPRRSGAHAGGGRRDPPPWVLMALTGAARSPSRSCPRGPLRRAGRRHAQAIRGARTRRMTCALSARAARETPCARRNTPRSHCTVLRFLNQQFH
jgi:hypothetical protein